MTTALMHAYETGVLVPEVHGKLVSNLPEYTRRANITDVNVYNTMSTFKCNPDEIDYFKKIKRQSAAGNHGVVYIGTPTNPVLNRMMGIAGACLRNFMDAKVVVLSELLDDIKERKPPDVSVLLIPNFFMSRADGGKIAEWHIQELLSLLYSRMLKNQQTFLYVSDFEQLRKAYGEPIYQHLANHFVSVEA